MFSNLITFSHFSVSSRTSLPKSADEITSGEAPRSVSRAVIFGSVRAALISLLSLSTISAGVPFGAPTPCHTRLETGNEITHGRDVRQHLRARGGCHRQGAQVPKALATAKVSVPQTRSGPRPRTH